MNIYFPGGKKVYAQYKGFTVKTDQPVEAGGEGEGPSPFDLFLTSLGTCAGYYIMEFCQGRGLSTEGIEVQMRLERDEKKKMIGLIGLDIHLPSDFPAKYKKAVAAAAQSCTVKKHIFDPPEFQVEVHGK